MMMKIRFNPIPFFQRNGNETTNDFSPALREKITAELQRRVNLALAKRCMGAFATVVGYWILIFATPYFGEHIRQALWVGAIYTLLIIIRIFEGLRLKAPQFVSAGIQRRKYAFWTIVGAVFWSGFTCLIFYYYAYSWVTFLVVITVTGFTSGAGTTLSPDFKLAIGYILSMVLPVLGCCIVLGGQIGFALGFLIFLFLIFCYSAVKGNYTNFKDTVINAVLIENHKNDLSRTVDKLAESNTKLRETTDALWGEMRLAQKIQTVLLPANPQMDGMDVAVHMAPATEVGGDYFDVINAGRDWVIVGDVSGHGVPAGLMMMMVQTAIQTLVRKFPDMSPSEVLLAVNAALKYNITQMGEDKYMSITLIAFDPDGHAMYCGLHQDLLIYRAATARVERVPSFGIWISQWDFDSAEIVDASFHMAIGDVLLLYTDGITEALHPDGTLFSEERLIDVFEHVGRSGAAHIKQAIIDSLENGYIIRDDVTMVIVKRTA